MEFCANRGRLWKYGTYIYAVEYKDVTLSEFDNGQNSGWMDTINDVHPGVGVAKQYLNDGDVIVPYR